MWTCMLWSPLEILLVSELRYVAYLTLNTTPLLLLCVQLPCCALRGGNVFGGWLGVHARLECTYVGTAIIVLSRFAIVSCASPHDG